MSNTTEQKPIRIQRKRTKGWKMPENTVYVGRPTNWGNPFKVSKYGNKKAVQMFEDCLLNNSMAYAYEHQNHAHQLFNWFTWMSKNLYLLRGKNLTCFCPLDQPCHADVLLKYANQ